LINVNFRERRPCDLESMSCTSESTVLAHARRSLMRVRSGVDLVRPRLHGADVRDLDTALAALADSFASLEAASDAQLPQRWSRFFACYDRVLALLRTFENSGGEID
jgi:hypothetical protein